jgi:EmrB/QacA subfamily drug resistance transporter
MTKTLTPKQRWVLTLTSLVSLMVALDSLVVTTALGAIRLDLHASIANLEWTVNAYNLSFAVLLMTGAVLADRFGRRRLLVLGLSLFVGASAACALAPSVGALIAARTVQGAGAALTMPPLLALLSEAFPPARRAWATGIFSAITGIAVVGGPLVGGAIAQGIAWRWIFWVNVPLGLVVIPLIRARIGETRGPRARPDLVGVALVTAAALGLVWGLVRGNAAGWGSAEVLGALIAGAVLTAGFVAWEARTSAPMLPLELFGSRSFSSANAATFLMIGSLFGAVFFMAQFLQLAEGHGPLGAGLRMMPWTGTLFVVAPISGALAGRIGTRPLIAGGLALQAAGFAWVAAVASPGMSYAALVPPLILAGAGISLAMPATQSAVMNAVAPERLGQASGTYNTVRQLGGVFGTAAAVAVFVGAGGYGSPAAFSDGFTAAITLAAGLSLLGALAGALAGALGGSPAGAVLGPTEAEAEADRVSRPDSLPREVGRRRRLARL